MAYPIRALLRLLQSVTVLPSRVVMPLTHHQAVPNFPHWRTMALRQTRFSGGMMRGEKDRMSLPTAQLVTAQG